MYTWIHILGIYTKKNNTAETTDDGSLNIHKTLENPFTACMLSKPIPLHSPIKRKLGFTYHHSELE